MLSETHEAVIRIEASLPEKITDLEHTVYGNGKPGLKEEVVLLKQSHKDCEKRQDKAQAQKPGRMSNIIAVGALVVAALSPFIANWLGNKKNIQEVRSEKVTTHRSPGSPHVGVCQHNVIPDPGIRP